jgi:DNA-binding transcriptional LysR family regulator
VLCERCKAGEALQHEMFVLGSAGAFCADCLAALIRSFYVEHPEVMATMPPGLTVDQLIDEQLRIMQAMLSASDPSDPEQLVRKLREGS